MKVISSQRYVNDEIVAEKKIELSGRKSVALPIFEVGIDDLYILADGHHRFEAAKQLGIKVEFEVIDHAEKLSGEALLENEWMDDDYYDIQTGKIVF